MCLSHVTNVLRLYEKKKYLTNKQIESVKILHFFKKELMISKHKSNIFCFHSLKVQMQNLLFYIFGTIKVIVGFKTLPASLILIWYLICFCQIATRWWQEPNKPCSFFLTTMCYFVCVSMNYLLASCDHLYFQASAGAGGLVQVWRV